MFTKKDLYFKFNAQLKSWTMSAGRWSQSCHFGIARPSQKPNRDSQDTFLAFVNREARRDAQLFEAENQRHADVPTIVHQLAPTLISLQETESPIYQRFGLSKFVL